MLRDLEIERILTDRGVKWKVDHQDGDPLYSVEGNEKASLQSGGDQYWVYGLPDGMVEELNGRDTEKAVDLLLSLSGV